MCCSASAIHSYRALRRTRTRRQIENELAAGLLTRVRRGVYADRSACDRAVTAAAHGGELACTSAAAHLGLWVLQDEGVHVWMDRDGHQYVHDDCTCTAHWDDAVRAGGVATPVARILAQIYRCRGAEEFFVALESARRKRLLRTPQLRALGRDLDAAARTLIDFSRPDADSGLESLVRFRLRRFGWDVRTQQSIVGTGRVDLLIDGWLIIEADGKQNHDGESNRHKDLVRDANSATWGFVTLRFDYALIVHDWELVEHAIIATVARYGR